MQASSYDIKDILVAVTPSLGLVFGITLFVNAEPALPNDCVTIFDTSGFPSALGLTDQGYEYPSIQIRVRDKHQQAGWTLIEKIKVALHGSAQKTVNGTLYSVIYCASSPALLDWDDLGRVRLVINFNLQRR